MNNEIKDYLDKLRDGGTINMFEAPQYLMSEFGLEKKEARQAFIEWTKTFEN